MVHRMLSRVRRVARVVAVGSVVGVRRGCVHRARRRPLLGVAIRHAAIRVRRVLVVRVAWRVHRTSGDGWDVALLVNGGLGVHSLLWSDVP